MAELDGLALPPTWESAKTVVKSQGSAEGCVELINPDCPTVTRYFVASGELTDLFEEAKGAVEAAGFGSFEERHPDCDSTLSGPVCSFDATKAELALQVNVYLPGEDVDQLGLSEPDLATIRMTLSGG